MMITIITKDISNHSILRKGVCFGVHLNDFGEFNGGVYFRGAIVSSLCDLIEPEFCVVHRDSTPVPLLSLFIQCHLRRY